MNMKIKKGKAMYSAINPFIRYMFVVYLVLSVTFGFVLFTYVLIKISNKILNKIKGKKKREKQNDKQKSY